MPPLIIWALGAIGAAVVARWFIKEARRVNAELHGDTAATVAETAEPEALPKLKRDPTTGVYRPK
jgi:hypothetical protein